MPPPDTFLAFLRDVFDLNALKTDLHEVRDYLELAVEWIFIFVGLWVAYLHLREKAIDYFERLRDKEHRFRVRTTIVKDMMDEQQTQTAKLRRLRVSKNMKKLILDPWPTIVPLNSEEERDAELAQFYSVPGRLGTQEEPNENTLRNETKFLLNLSLDEQLRAHREYSTLLIYTLDEKLDDILSPPEFIAAQPVGKECFTYEAHFPPTRRFVRRKAPGDTKRRDKPIVRVFKGSPENKRELRYESYTRQGRNPISWYWQRFVNKFRTRYHVMGGSTDFGDRVGKHDWFRVTILKPPQKEDIHICWCMEGDPATLWNWCSHAADDHKKA
jgi:hypothetical protein